MPTTPSKRLKTCFLVAVTVHAVALIGVRMPDRLEPAHSPTPLMVSVVASPLQQKSPKNLNNDPSKAPNRSHTFSAKRAHIAQSQHKPVRKRTISAQHHQPEDEPYLVKWQERIEDIGNQNYPKNALKNNLNGSLRLMVSINKDGSVNEVSLRKSSGHQELDEAAINIVHMAAPFEPFPPEIASTVDVLDIIRTWQFRGTFTSKG